VGVSAALTRYWLSCNKLLITGSIIISGVQDYEFVVYRRFNHVTCLYITNRYVTTTSRALAILFQSTKLQELIIFLLYRISATICIIGYFVLNIATAVDCSAINKMTAISEGLCQLTSSALLSLRYITMNSLVGLF
jgi:hypothetical protein